MCVVDKQFELLEFVLIPFILTCSIIRFISVLPLGRGGVRLFGAPGWNLERGPISNEAGNVYFGITYVSPSSPCGT